MGSALFIRDRVYWVPNPVNATENFADKWRAEPKKKEAFFDWLHKVNADFNKLTKSQTSNDLLNCLYAMFGQKVVDLTNNNLGGYTAIVPTILQEQTEMIPYAVKQALSVQHRQKAPWRLPPWNIVKIQATAGVGYSARQIESGEQITKGLKLTFEAIHSIQSPYTVKWQITNTGTEARLKECLRGGFYNSDPETNNIRTEDAEYTGIHYIQCFILKKGKCVAKSREFIVNIR